MPRHAFKIVFFGGICLVKILYVDGHCVDIHSQIVSQGLHYVPGPNSCTLCICDKGGPKWCKSVLCSQPQNCKSFQRGNSCCEFKCLDDILTANDTYKDTYDLALRLIASAVFVVLTLLLLFFFVHRFRKHKLRVRQNRQLSEDQRSLNSIGYITGSLGYLPGSIGYLGSSTNDLEFPYEESNAHFTLWKPPGNYFPRGEAPPPYEEAIRSAQIDTNVINNNQNTLVCNVNNNGTQIETESQPLQQQSSRTNQQNNQIQCRHQHLTGRSAVTSANQEYVNVTIENVAAAQQSTTNQVARGEKSTIITPSNIKTSASEDKLKSYENITISRRKTERQLIAACIERKSVKQKAQVDKNSVKIRKYENSTLRNSVPKDASSVRKPIQFRVSNDEDEVHYENITPVMEPIRHRSITHLTEFTNKSVPQTRDLKTKDEIYILSEGGTSSSNVARRDFDKSRLGERTSSNLRNLSLVKECKDVLLHRTLPKNLKELTVSVSSNSELIGGDVFKKFENDSFIHRTLPKQLGSHDTILSVNLVKSQINLRDNCNEISPLKSNDSKSTSSSRVDFQDKKNEDAAKLKDDRRNFISYQCLSSSQEEDDYRSECENCKSSEITSMEDEEGDVFNETMTLQRRPETNEEVPYYRTSLTLPTQIRKPRAVTPNSNRNGWFMAMQEHSSSEESE